MNPVSLSPALIDRVRRACALHSQNAASLRLANENLIMATGAFARATASAEAEGTVIGEEGMRHYTDRIAKARLDLDGVEELCDASMVEMREALDARNRFMASEAFRRD